MRVHIAGFPVRVGNKGRQLCAWCGVVLFDVDYERICVAPNADGSPGDGPRPWEINALVAVEGNGMWTVPDEGGKLPLQCCAVEVSIRLVEPAAKQGAKGET